MARWMATAAAAVLALTMLAAAARAQAPADTAPASPPPEIAELQRLLATPAVQEWLRAAPAGAAASASDGAVAPEQALSETPGEAAEAVAEAVAEAMDPASLAAVLDRTAAHRAQLMRALPALPWAIGVAMTNLATQAREHGLVLVALMVAALVASGLVAEWRFVRVTRGLRKSVLGADEDTMQERLRKLGMRVALALGAVLVFAVASLGVLLLIELPPVLHDVAGRVLFAAILYRLALYSLRLTLSPEAPQRRVVPMADDWARFWLRHLTLFAGVFLTGWTVATSLRVLGAPFPAPLLIAYMFGFGLLAIAVTAIWRRRAKRAEAGEGGAAPAALWTIWCVLLFAMWLSGTNKLFWLALVAGALPMAIGVVNAAVNHLLRERADDADAKAPPSVLAAVIERGARVALILAAAWTLLWAWDVSYAQLLGGDDGFSRAARAILNVAFIVFVFDFIWHVSRTAIDRFVADASTEGLDTEELRRRARLRTLLPILRNLLHVALGVTAALMALASLGVQIAPLIAGAGVLGVAIGFGAQTVVKDVISGMFYLLDDAFRVGEYIVAGSYKGTVESFSLRSIKLRHHRGPLFTIPFGSLGAVQNVSREWVIDKLRVTVPFDTDTAKLKKVIKGVSAELMADPALAPGFLEPLKSQGIDAIGDHGLAVTLKFKAIPGTQFPIRRRAYALIQKAFADNGIAFAFPTVRVAAGEDREHAEAVAAARALAPATAAS